MVEQINENQFEQVLANNKIVVVDYYAQWCGPCKMMHPIFEELSNQMQNIKFVRIDIDQNTPLALKNNIQVVPTFVLYNNATEVNRILGYNSKEDFKLFLQTI